MPARVRQVRLTPTGERCVRITLPAHLWEQAQGLIRAVNSQSVGAEESSRKMLELVRPYVPAGFQFNPRTDTVELIREPKAQVLTPAGAPA